LNYLKGENSEEIISTIKEEVRKQFKFFKTSGNFKDYLTSKYVEILEKSDINMTLKKKEDYSKLYTDLINPLFIEKMMNKYGSEKWNEKIFEEILALSSIKLTDEEFFNIQ